MPNARGFVMTYSIVLVVLFISFLYLITTIDPITKPHGNESSTEPTTPSPNKTSPSSVPENKYIRARGHTAPKAFTKNTKRAVKIQDRRRKEDIINGITKTVRFLHVKIFFSRNGLFV